jgi:hypothetical protein
MCTAVELRRDSLVGGNGESARRFTPRNPASRGTEDPLDPPREAQTVGNEEGAVDVEGFE